MKEQGLEELVMSHEELKMFNARKRLQKPMVAFVRRFRARNLKRFMSIKIQRAWRMYREREYSFVRGLELEKYPVIFYLKEQRIRFADLIAETCKKMKSAYEVQDI